MYAEPHRLALLLLAALTATAARAADEQVFEPGSKHVCVPAASGEGWDCRSTDATPPVPAEPEKKSREPRLRSSSQIPDEAPRADTETAPPAPAPAGVERPAAAAPTAPPAVTAPPPAAAAPRASPRNVPHYLLAPEARASAASAPAAAPTSSAPPAAPRSAPPAPAAAPAAIESPAPRTSASTAPAREAPARTAPAAAPEPVRTAPASPPSPEPVVAAPAAAPAPEPPRAAPPAPAGPAPSAPVARDTALLGATEFRRLGDSRYVIELASGNSRDAVESEAGAPTRGEVYLLPLTRDGEAWYVAVWGDFESVDAARSARAEALASGASRVGWPRRVGPLKQELGR